MKVKLILEDGQIFEGTRIGAVKDVICELVFNTAVTGYVELMTDPSYAGQGVIMSSPIIGNYGVFDEDFESKRPRLSAFIVRYITELKNDPRNACDLDEFLKKYDIAGITDIDTRLLTLTIREKGTMKGMITGDENPDLDKCLGMIREYKCISRVPQVSTPVRCKATEIITNLKDRNLSFVRDYIAKGNSYNKKYKVALMDYGAKANIGRLLEKFGCDVTYFPWNTTAEEIMEFSPEGIMLSNGPGDPKECHESIVTIKKLYNSNIPIFGICLGHQLMALAAGFDTFKLRYGHRGVNHPVRNEMTGNCFITSQNHSYSVIPESIDENLAKISYININDSSIEGLEYCNKDIFTVQFHPEGAPGPMDTVFLFERFIEIMDRKRLLKFDVPG